MTASSSIDLYWLPLGAGGRSVRWNGRMFEAAMALRAHRPRTQLYHSALVVSQQGRRYVIEMGPVWEVDAPDRGVVCEGPVGSRVLGRWRLFRYEVRCWPAGRVGDAAEAVASPQRLSEDESQVARALEVVSAVPALTWGRDEIGAGEMWNSNSLTSWLLSGCGVDMTVVAPPAGGRAPGWTAGLVLASRQIPARH